MIRYQRAFDSAPPAKFDGVFLWDFLRGAFGPTIEPMDFDGVVERRGNFLVFETKAPGALMSKGQRLTLLALIRDRRFTVVYTAKTPETITGWEVWTRQGTQQIIGDCDDLKAWCVDWYQRVNAADPVW